MRRNTSMAPKLARRTGSSAGAVSLLRELTTSIPVLALFFRLLGEHSRRPREELTAWPCFKELPLALGASGAPESLCRLPGRFEGRCGIFSCHSDGRLNVGQTASSRSSKHCRRCGLLVRELTNGHPVMAAKGQVPPNELTPHAVEELGNRVLTIFCFSQYPFD